MKAIYSIIIVDMPLSSQEQRTKCTEEMNRKGEEIRLQSCHRHFTFEREAQWFIDKTVVCTWLLLLVHSVALDLEMGAALASQ